MFAVWEPMLLTDWAAPTTIVLHRMRDLRTRQYWDENHLLAIRMAKDARPPQPAQDCCTRNEILWDLAAVYPKGVRWTDRIPAATLFDGPVVDVADRIEAAISARRP